MNYITVKEASNLWAISDRRVRQYLSEGKIDGAIHQGRVWLIPEDSSKPEDSRKSSSRNEGYHKYSFPFLLATKAVNDRDSLSPMDRRLLEAQEDYTRGDCLKAISTCEKLISETEDPFILSGCYFILSLSHMWTDGSFAEHRKYYYLLCATYHPDDQKHKELLVFSVLSAFYQNSECPEWLAKGRFGNLSDVSLSWASAAYIFYQERIHYKNLDPSYYEPMCSRVETDHIPLTEEYLHLHMGLLYHYQDKPEDARYHMNKAIDIALRTGYITPLAELRRVVGLSLDRILKERNAELADKVIRLNNELMKGWDKIFTIYNGHYIAKNLSMRENEVYIYLVRKMKYEEIAKALGIAQETAKSIINSIYKKLHVSGRKELLSLIAARTERSKTNSSDSSLYSWKEDLRND